MKWRLTSLLLGSAAIHVGVVAASCFWSSSPQVAVRAGQMSVELVSPATVQPAAHKTAPPHPTPTAHPNPHPKPHKVAPRHQPKPQTPKAAPARPPAKTNIQAAALQKQLATAGTRLRILARKALDAASALAPKQVHPPAQRRAVPKPASKHAPKQAAPQPAPERKDPAPKPLPRTENKAFAKPTRHAHQPAAAHRGAVEPTQPRLLPPNEAPVYPESARRRGEHGNVTLRIHITAAGRVDGVQVLQSPSARLTRAAVDAVRQWRFQPAIRGSTPVACDVRQVIRFNLTHPD